MTDQDQRTTPRELWTLAAVWPGLEEAERRLVVAFHEAGHAVVGRALGRPCSALEVYYPGYSIWDGVEILGLCRFFEDPRGATDPQEDSATTLAGPIAAWRSPVGRGVFPSAPAWEAFLEYADEEGRGIEAAWEEASVASSVSRADDPAAAYADAWGVASQMVRDLWADIERVARELDRRGVLTGREVEELLGATKEERARFERFERFERERRAEWERWEREWEQRAERERERPDREEDRKILDEIDEMRRADETAPWRRAEEEAGEDGWPYK
jgi:hypothetical protein